MLSLMSISSWFWSLLFLLCASFGCANWVLVVALSVACQPCLFLLRVGLVSFCCEPVLLVNDVATCPARDFVVLSFCRFFILFFFILSLWCCCLHCVALVVLPPYCYHGCVGSTQGLYEG